MNRDNPKDAEAAEAQAEPVKAREWSTEELDAVSNLGGLAKFFVNNWFELEDINTLFNSDDGLMETLTQEDIDAIPALKAKRVQLADVKDVAYWFSATIYSTLDKGMSKKLRGVAKVAD